MSDNRALGNDLSRARESSAIELSNKFTSQHIDKEVRELTAWAKNKARSKNVTIVAFTK